MTDKESNLEGRLNATVGDLIRLANSDSNQEASGYISELKYSQVVLSHESPAKQVSWSSEGRAFTSFSRGDRKYNLAGFTEYEVLRKANQE